MIYFRLDIIYESITDFTASTNLSNRSVGKSEITSLPSAVNFIVVNIPAERDFIKRVPSPFSV